MKCMNRNCFKISALALVMLLLSTCTNPIDDINQFKMGINAGELVNAAVNLSFGIKGDDEALPQNISVRFEADGAAYLTDANGECFFDVSHNGMLKLLLSPEANPTESNPLLIKIIAEAKDCIPIEEEIYLTGRNNIPNIKLLFHKITNLPAGYKVQEYPAVFSGKKATDTLVFTHQNLNGLEFKFRYPVVGAQFVAKRKITYQVIRENTIFMSRDTTFQDSIDDYKIVGATKFFNKQPLDGKRIQVKRLVTKTKTIPVPVKVKDTVTTYRIIPETIPVQNVTARIISNTTEQLEVSGFYDNDGRYVNKPRLFTGAIEVPEVQFVTANGDFIEVIYPQDYDGGRIIEIAANDNSLSIYLSGITELWNAGARNFDYIPGNTIVPASKLPYKNGRLVFKDDYIFNKRFFLFRDMLVGCGFSKIKFPSDYDLESFWAYWTVEHGRLQYSYLYPTWYTSAYGSWRGFGVPEVSLMLPAFSEFGKAKVNFVVNHEYNSCLNKPVLYNKTEEFDPCVNPEFDFKVDYNPGTFWSQYVNLFTKVSVLARVTCQSGNLVQIPNQTVNYHRISCNPFLKTQTEIVNGKTELSLLNQSAYIISVFNPYNSSPVVDTLFLMEKNMPLEGYITNAAGEKLFKAFSGTLVYDEPKRSYRVDIVFEKPYFKYPIPGCD